MAAATMKKYLFFAAIMTILGVSSTQYLSPKTTNLTKGICRTVISHNMTELNQLKGCVVVIGNVKLVLMDKKVDQSFEGVSFPELKEITGYLVVYRVTGLKSLGELFPKLARIRGTELFKNYALIVHDMPNLQEIGLYNLLKIDRGSVIIYGPPTICFLDTIDWNAIAPRVRHVINRDPAEGRVKGVDCSSDCTCTQNYYTTNHCWNNRICQRFHDGPDAEVCHEQCLGCRKTKQDACTLCRNYTHEGNCVSSCPNNTLRLEVNKYCLSLEECRSIGGWIFNNTCVLGCPIDYQQKVTNGITTCVPCEHCAETCRNLYITSLETMQDASTCVYVNGSLTIHVRAITEAMSELRTYLTRLKEVTDYVVIYGSLTITSLDFLPSLSRIKGRKLKSGSYSLIIYDMTNLQTLFTANVTKNLKIDKGTARIYNNPMLCKDEIDKVINLLPTKPNDVEVPASMNGYSGSCTQVERALKVKTINTSAAIVTFERDESISITYSVLYIRLIPGDNSKIVPESCSDTEWFGVKVQSLDKQISVTLTDLKPASNYLLCVEAEDKIDSSTVPTKINTSENTTLHYVTRTSIVNFSTEVGTPEPPFLSEVVAVSANSIVVHWVNHKDYSRFVTYYELDLVLIETSDNDINSRDHCEYPVPLDDILDHYEYSPHAVLKRPPESYEKPCETMCGILSKGITGAMVQEDFDPCLLGLQCDGIKELDSPKNTTFGDNNYYSSLALIINGTKNEYQVGNLAPYRDYRVRLRACTDSKCSRSNRRAIRTKALRDADLVTILESDAYDGEVNVKWEAPKDPNGPILYFTLQVKSKRRYYEFSTQISQDACVLNSIRSATVLTIPADSYLVRVCTTTLIPDKTCTDWLEVIGQYKDLPPEFLRQWWWPGFSGLTGAILICLASYFGQRYFPIRGDDQTPLVRRESDESTASGSTVNIGILAGQPSTSRVENRFLRNFTKPFAGAKQSAVEVELNTYNIRTGNPFVDLVNNSDDDDDDDESPSLLQEDLYTISLPRD